MGASVSLPKLFGIPVRLHFSWFLIFALFTILFESHFNSSYYRWSAPERLVASLATSTLLFISVLGHELSHSLLARRQGLPVKNITLFLFGGVSHIEEEAERPYSEFTIALVGPLASVLIGLMYLGMAVGLNMFSRGLASIAEIMFMANIALGIFNMLPLFPMDGGRILRALLWKVTGSHQRATYVATTTTRLLATVMVGLGIALAALVDGFLFSGMWMVVLGVFLQVVSSNIHRQQRIHQSLEGLVAGDLVSAVPHVPVDWSVHRLLEEDVVPPGTQAVFVEDGGGVAGTVSTSSAAKVPRGERRTTLVSSLLVPLAELVTVSADLSATALVDLMDTKGLNYVVVEGGASLGLVQRRGLERFAGRRPLTKR